MIPISWDYQTFFLQNLQGKVDNPVLDLLLCSLAIVKVRAQLRQFLGGIYQMSLLLERVVRRLLVC